MHFKIKIKPFTEPPKIPFHYLETSLLKVLLPSLESILYQNNNAKTSREELYRTVQDLCTQGHGISLYTFLIQVINHAASVMVQRHCCCHDTTTTNTNNNTTTNKDPNGNQRTCSSTTQSVSPFLSCMIALWNEYTEYLAYVRNIFQHLDNLFVYVPSIGTVLPRQQLHHHTRTMEQHVPIAATATSSTTTTAAVSESSTLNQSTWSLWEVGLFALYRPLMMKFHNNNNMSSIDHQDSLFLEPSDELSTVLAHFRQTIVSIMTLQLDHGIFCDGTINQDIAEGNVLLSSSLSSSNHFHRHHNLSSLDISRVIRDSIFFLQQLNTVSTGYTVLWSPSTITTMNTSCTTQSSLFVYSSSSSSSSSPTSTRQQEEDNKTKMISFPCTIIKTHSIMQLFFQEMAISLMTFFSNECQLWMRKMDETTTHTTVSSHEFTSLFDIHKNRMDTTTTTTSTASTHILHTLIRYIDARLKQVHGMTCMYFNPLLMVGNQHTANQQYQHHTEVHDHNSIAWNIQQKRFLLRIVELFLLTPLFTSSFLLHPHYFYPVLDEPMKEHLLHLHLNTNNESSSSSLSSSIMTTTLNLKKNTKTEEQDDKHEGRDDPRTTAITLESQRHTLCNESFFYYIQRLYSLSKRVIYKDTSHHIHGILSLLESIFPSSSSSDSSSTFMNSISSLLPSTDVDPYKAKLGTGEYSMKPCLNRSNPFVPSVESKNNEVFEITVSKTSFLLPSTDGTTGLDRFKQGLIEYGLCRGLACLRPPVPNLPLYGPTMASNNNNTNMASNKDILCKSIIPALLEFKSHLERLNNGAFSNDATLAKCIKNVLEQVLNSHVTSQDDAARKITTGKRPVEASALTYSESDGGIYVAELLAKFVDYRFKDPKSTSLISSIEASNTNDSDTFQHAILELFRHIQSKDVFEAFYRRDLAKRLMLNKSTSIDAERSFVSKLKAECGSGYTSKMEGMFQDIELSKDVMSMYHSYLDGNNVTKEGGTPIDIEVQVLTTGYWPVYPQCASLILPKHVMKQKEIFETYYNNKYQGRRIAWQHSLGTCIVRAMFPKIGIRELIVSLPQALVLNCYNDDSVNSDAKPQGFTICEIMKMTGLDDRSETERVLQSLSLGRDGTRVLTKIDVDTEDKASIDNETNQSSKAAKMKKFRRNVSDNDLFIFNSSFTSNQHRIKITNIQVKETSDERDKTHEGVSQDRLYLIDAAIVRIMKARKSMEHRTLVGEVMTQIKFPANSSDIKKRIESLIEREYLERADGDRALYNYLA